MARVRVLGLQLVASLHRGRRHRLTLERSTRTRCHPLTRSLHSAARAGLGTVVRWALAARLLTRLELAPELKGVALPRIQLLREVVLVLGPCARRLAEPGLLKHGP